LPKGKPLFAAFFFVRSSAFVVRLAKAFSVHLIPRRPETLSVAKVQGLLERGEERVPER